MFIFRGEYCRLNPRSSRLTGLDAAMHNISLEASRACVLVADCSMVQVTQTSLHMDVQQSGDVFQGDDEICLL